jgi:hypothetical protein
MMLSARWRPLFAYDEVLQSGRTRSSRAESAQPSEVVFLVSDPQR